MKYLYTTFFSLALATIVLVPTAHAQTTTASLLAQVKALKAQLAAIEQELLLRSTTIPVNNVELKKHFGA